MNFFDNLPNFSTNTQQPMINNPFMLNNDINFRIKELELKIKTLEQRLSLLETTNNNNYIEPDNSLYMI